MRKRDFLLALVAIALFASCEKEDSAPKENYIKATIDNQLFVAYENSELNTDTVPNTFSFSFGQGITTGNGKSDTCLFFNVSLNRYCLGLNFPKTSKPQTFTIYRSTDVMEQPSAYFMWVQEYVEKDGLVVYQTHNMEGSDNTTNQKVGEIKITRIDWESRIVEGTFYYTAYGYEQSTEQIVETSKLVNVSNGEFYYHWSQGLKIE